MNNYFRLIGKEDKISPALVLKNSLLSANGFCRSSVR